MCVFCARPPSHVMCIGFRVQGLGPSHVNSLSIFVCAAIQGNYFSLLTPLERTIMSYNFLDRRLFMPSYQRRLRRNAPHDIFSSVECACGRSSKRRCWQHWPVCSRPDLARVGSPVAAGCTAAAAAGVWVQAVVGLLSRCALAVGLGSRILALVAFSTFSNA